MCIHVNIARGKQHGDPRKIPALPRKSAHGDALNESRAHTGSTSSHVGRSDEACWASGLACCVLLCAAVSCCVLLCVVVITVVVL